jgi:uncharacterized membrane protein
MTTATAQPSYRYLPVVARVLLVVIGVLPWIMPIAESAVSLGAVGVLLDRIFWPMCHRFPARTLTLAGELMPLCSRCAGIFAGIAIGALIARPRLRLSAWGWIFIAASVAMVIDVITQDLGVHPVSHPARIATGAALGYAMAAAFVTGVLDRLSRAPASRGASPRA